MRRRIWRLLLTASLPACCGCRTADLAPTSEPTAQEVTIAALAHMVTLADDDSTTIRFVNLAADEIERLKRTTGGSYTIYPTQSAEVRTVEAIAPSGASFHQKHICLRGTDREGQILEARVVRVGARDAEVRGSFALGGSRVVVSYKLRLTGGRWAVTASKNVFAT